MKIRKEEGRLVNGSHLLIDGEPFYKIANYDRMQPFLVSVVSDSDLWLYTSSLGGLSAGRKDPDNALFPYYTDDKLHDAHHQTGSFTRIRVNQEKDVQLWAPFHSDFDLFQNVERNLYKNKIGNKLIFEEINHDLQLRFSYGWYMSDRYGIVRKSALTNLGDTEVRLDILDGIRNILPWGIQRLQQMTLSTLMDAYKKSELQEASGVAIYSLSSIPVDRAEPSESLRANFVWNTGLNPDSILLSNSQINDFIYGNPITGEVDIRAKRGAYLMSKTLALAPEETCKWIIVADVNKTSSDLHAILDCDLGAISKEIEMDIDAGSRNLDILVGSADGIQLSASTSSVNRHFSNTLFNIMRGGTFQYNYSLPKSDFQKHLHTLNNSFPEKYSDLLLTLPEQMEFSQLLDVIENTDDIDLTRAIYEYLPLIFGRRHGDPSRPWNLFSINIRDAAGQKVLSFEGNWRDIFQNWEALSISYPGFLNNMIAKFLNASTPDGYNPYRINRDGIDWEVLDPEDSWSYVGYWGDHQIVYFFRLLQQSFHHDTEMVTKLLTTRVFTFGNVPYRIKSYEEIVSDPYDTIIFDHDLHSTIMEKTERIGSDGKLLWKDDSTIEYGSLVDKILIQVLTKLYNFVPDAGVWLNTQRPEWNDANNALVGDGASMVTVYYLRKYIMLIEEVLNASELDSYPVYSEVHKLFQSLTTSFNSYLPRLEKGFDEESRKQFTDIIGMAGSEYRTDIYNNGFSGNLVTLNRNDLLQFLDTVLKFIDNTITRNRRQDGLYHAYNLIRFEENRLDVNHLYEMLEGQVAVLSSGFLGTKEASDVLKGLRNSAMYRADQDSYTLYPDRLLPRFIEKNTLPEELINTSGILSSLKDQPNTIIIRNIKGSYHFNPDFRNKNFLEQEMKELGYGDAEVNEVAEVYETIFKHREFTGRSGTFFAYEGLGSIYWHMVSKLLLAIQENYWEGLSNGATSETLQYLKEHYYLTRAGIGYDKNPESYGAFPNDAYSHTPANAGVRQPGLTGQVKEDVINRFGELGVFVVDGCIHFKPGLLRESEFLDHDTVFSYYDVQHEFKQIALPEGSLAFTYCQVPIVYKLKDEQTVQIHTQTGTRESHEPLLDKETSNGVFSRNGSISRIEVGILASSLM